MSFLKSHRATIAVFATLALFVGVVHMTGGFSGCGSSCPISALFAANNAYANPACAKTCSTPCDAKTKDAAATTPAASDPKTCPMHAEGKTCNKDECIKMLMSKGMTKEQAEAAYAACHTGSGVTTASATTESTCPHAMTTAAVATVTAGKSCGDKETCIAKCMSEKGMTRAEAEACWAKCQAEKEEGGCSHMVSTAAAVETSTVPSREACIDAMVAKGMSRVDAEAHMAKCEKEGMTAEAAAKCCDKKSGEKGCCAKHKTAESTTPSTGDAH